MIMKEKKKKIVSISHAIYALYRWIYQSNTIIGPPKKVHT